MTTDWIAGWQGAQHDWQRRQQWGRHFLVDIMHLSPSHRLLDLGCGPLCLGSQLIAYLDPGHYTGIDRNPEVLNAGAALIVHLGLEGRAPQLLCTEDLDTVECGQDFDVVWSHSVLIHMNPTTVDSALRLMARTLRPGGTAYFTMNLGPHRVLGTWIYGPNYQHPFPAHPALSIREIASLEALGDVVWCPPESGMRAVMLEATRRPHGALVGQRVEPEPAHAG